MDTAPQDPAPARRPTVDVAIVGLGCVLPDAPNVAAYWQNLLDGRVSIREVARERWDPAIHHSTDRARPDTTYSKIGAFVSSIPFNPVEFRIPPKVAASMDDVQKMALVATREALADARLLDRIGKDLDPSRVAIIIGNSMGGEVMKWTDRRVALREAIADIERDTTLDTASKALARKLLEDHLDRLPSITEDSMPGELSNVIAGRIAQVFNLQGKSQTTDAACASTLAAVDSAVRTLSDGEHDLVVCGGADRSNDPSTYTKFSKIGALSADGSFPFDERASGFVMGEGCGILILKRLDDAQRDGDRVYAVVRGVGGSSDGKGKGITAPNPNGQELAIRRALESAGLTPADLQVIEAHGTATPVGDVVEAEVLAKVFAGSPPGSIQLGSVKGNIGHLKSAAGAASLIKAALAIHHRTLPPTPGHERPNPRIKWGQVPMTVTTKVTPWPGRGVRRVGVSGFGFGGTNYHIILEQTPTTSGATVDTRSPQKARGGPGTVPADPPRSPATPAVAPTGWDVGLVHAHGKDALVAAIKAGSVSSPANVPPAGRVAFAYETAKGPAEALATAERLVTGALPPALAGGRGVFAGMGPADGKAAFLFPGQGSQYAGMLVDLAAVFPQARATLEEADRVLAPLLGSPLSTLLVPGAGESAEHVEERLRQTEICQPAVLACDVAILRVLEAQGLRPDVVAGHSLGEYAALVAAGVLSFGDALVAVSARGREMASVHVPDKGTMAFVGAPRDVVDRVLAACTHYVVAANKNSPTQTVIAGSTAGVEEALRLFAAAGVTAKKINVSAAFHSEIVAPATGPLRRVLDRLTVNAPRVPLLANVTGEYYPTGRDAILDMLSKQVASPVEWDAQVRRMHADGVRLFVEVGPKTVLARLVPEILGAAPHVAVGTNHPKTGGVASLYHALAAWVASGRPLAATTSGTTEAQSALRDTETQGRSARSLQALRDSAVTGALVVSGAAIGLPGQEKPVFDDGNLDAIFRGENRIDRIADDELRVFTSKNIQRLVKDRHGAGHFEAITDPSQVIKLSGRKGRFDLAADYGLDRGFCDGLDITTRLAIAAGIEALRDAGVPLVREQKATTKGTFLPGGWVLPQALQDDTGIIFASAFPGYDNLLREVEAHMVGAVRGGSHAFDRKFLFKVLAFGHAQFAQLIRARGPNLQVNSACATTTAAIAMAEDWIRQGRCRRVIIIAADDVTSEHLLPWIGSGFLAAGAATTAGKVEEAALPFDRRRHGMIIGMGAAALVIEPGADVAARGMEPVAELAGTLVANSAFHGSRLDADHIARVFDAFVDRLSKQEGIERAGLARDLTFVSHETYTPARGGSASAEVAALRAAFGPAADDVLMANIKGFTGHPQGVGLEDVVAAKILEHRRAPPIPNFREPDPELGVLNLSKGGRTERRFTIRLAAGFGSQVAFAAFRQACAEPRRRDEAMFRAWVARVSGVQKAELEVVNRTLRVKEAPRATTPGTAQTQRAQRDAQTRRPEPIAPVAAPAPSAPPSATLRASALAPTSSRDEVLALLVKTVAEKTGYPPDVIDPALDMEADLGIDTVKQAELFAHARETLGVARDESLKIADYNTLAKVADYFHGRLGASVPATPGTTQTRSEQGATEQQAIPLGPSATLRASAVTGGSPIKRLVPTLEPLASGPVTPMLAGRLVVVQPDHQGVAGALARLLQQAGASPMQADAGEKLPAGAFFVDLSLLDHGPVPPNTAAVRAGRDVVLSIAARLRNAGAVLGAKEGVVLLACDLGGHLGLDGPVNFVQAGATGLSKSLDAEVPARVRAVDVGPADPATRAAWVLDELCRADGGPEVCRNAAGRFRSAVIEAPAPPAAADLPADAVLLVSGGAQGITARLMAELAGAHPGWRFVLVGRTPADDTGHSLDPDDAKAVAALRAGLFDEAKAAGPVKPADVERRLDGIVKGQRVQKVLRSIDPTGSRVAYFAADATDPSRLAAAVRQAVARWGRIDAVVHAAGIERSKLFADKPAEEWAETFDVKVLGTQALLDATNAAGPKVFVGFGSVAGRFGNPAQSDYAAGNDALAKLPAMLAAVRPGMRGVTVHWTAWEGAGMATRESVRKVLVERGVTFLPFDEGSRRFQAELLGGRGEVVHADPRPFQASSIATAEARSAQTDRRDTSEPSDARAPSAPTAGPAVAPSSAPAKDQILRELIVSVSEKTGYPADVIDPALDMEADLGIDTVKQAELFASARETYGVARDDGLKIADYNTLDKVAQYFASRVGAVPATMPPTTADTPKAAPAQRAGQAGNGPMPTPPPAAHPVKVTGDALLSEITLSPGRAEAVVRIDTSGPAIQDHSIRGVPIIAGVYGLDAMARLARAAGIADPEFADVAFEKPLKIPSSGTLDVRVRLEPDGAGGQRATLVSRLTPAGSTSQGADRVHFSARVRPGTMESPRSPGRLRGSAAAPTAGATGRDEILRALIKDVSDKTGYPIDVIDPALDMEADLGIDTVKQAELFAAARETYGIPRDDTLRIADYNTLAKVTDYFASRVAAPAVQAPGAGTSGLLETFGADMIYQVFFHGPRYQVLKHADVEGDTGRAIVAIPPTDVPAARFLAVEAAFQTAGAVETLGRASGVLPVGAARVAFGPGDAATAATATARQTGPHPRGSVWDAEVVDAAGLLVVRVEGLVLAGADAARFVPEQPGPRPGATDALPETATVTAVPKDDGPPPPKAEIDPLEATLTHLAAESTLPFARIAIDDAWGFANAEYPFLAPPEFAGIQRAATPKRRAEHAAGLLAAKRAVASLLGLDTSDAGLQRLVVEHDGLRAPTVRLPDGTRVPVSITHGHGSASAVASDLGRPGLDVEKVEARAESFVEDAFAPDERSTMASRAGRLGLTMDEMVTLAWTLKEAALKAAGRGLTVDLHSVRVVELAPGTATVRLEPGTDAHLGWAVTDGFAVALARPLPVPAGAKASG